MKDKPEALPQGLSTFSFSHPDCFIPLYLRELHTLTILFSSDLNESVPSKHLTLKLCFQIKKKKIYWFCWVFIAACGLSPVVASGLQSTGLQWACSPGFLGW